MIVFLSKLWGYNYYTFSSVVLWRANIFLKLVRIFFINVYACRKNKLKIMIAIFKNHLPYRTLVVCLESHYYVTYWISFFIMAWWAIFSQIQWYFGSVFIVMAVVGNFNFSYFLRIIWEFLGLEIEHGGPICWPNNMISQYTVRLQFFFFFPVWCYGVQIFFWSLSEFFLSMFMPVDKMNYKLWS